MSNASIRNNIMARFDAKRAVSKNKSLPLSLQKMFPVNKEVAKVIVRVPASLQKRLKEAEIAATFDSMGLRYLPNSLARAHEKNQELFSGFVSTKRQVMTDEVASSKGLTEVASNVFTDDLDNVWDRQMVDGKAVFVCTAGDDVELILRGYRDTNIATASLEIASSTQLVAGDAVVFYDTTSETASFGVATGKDDKVYIPSEDKFQEVPGIMVLAAHSGKHVGLSKEDLLEYFRKLYGQNAEFYNKLKELVNTYLFAY